MRKISGGRRLKPKKEKLPPTILMEEAADMVVRRCHVSHAKALEMLRGAVDSGKIPVYLGHLDDGAPRPLDPKRINWDPL